MRVGINKIAYYTPGYYLDLKTLAGLYEKDPAGYYDVLGQEKMAVPAPDEDSVTMGANAAWQIIKDIDPSKITSLYFATESGTDQSKSAGMYLHKMLGLRPECRVVELKQACYSGTFALRAAMDHVALRPEEECLIVASDIARYGLGSPGEPTQGAGAIAMLISASPKVFSVSDESGIHAEDAMDFWRPNYKDEAFVDGQYSVRLYMRTLALAFEDYYKKTQRDFRTFARFCFHLPFSTIAEKAYARLAKKHDIVVNDALIQEKVLPAVEYNRLTGNCYTASLYQGLCSLLDSDSENLSNTEIAMFSYGSGSMAEFFSGTVQEGYREHLYSDYHQELLSSRRELSYEEYKRFYNFKLPRDGQDFQCPRHSQARIRLAGIKKHKRLYEVQK